MFHSGEEQEGLAPGAALAGASGLFLPQPGQMAFTHGGECGACCLGPLLLAADLSPDLGPSLEPKLTPTNSTKSWSQRESG